MTTVAPQFEWLCESVHHMIAERRHHPTATYRLQFHGKFRFRDAAELLPYLKDLGISHLYASPYFQARPGSMHGYDVVDHQSLEPAIGSVEEYRSFISRQREAGMGQILDVVPNHMGIATDINRWWNNVLEHGPSSPFANFFDIDWKPAKEELRNKILLPILGEQYGDALEAGHLSLECQDGTFCIRCYESALPIDPKSTITILNRDLEAFEEQMGSDSPHFLELRSILTALEHLPPRQATGADRIEERQRETVVIKRRLQTLSEESTEFLEHLQKIVQSFNGTPGQPESFDALDQLLNEQVYRLAHWKVAGDEINYRRFFDVNELAAICMEREEVFERTHGLILELLACGAVSGLRIDHIDGLYDPNAYLWRLQWEYVRRLAKLLFDRSRSDDNRASDTIVEPGDLSRLCTDHFDDENVEWSEIEEPLMSRLKHELQESLRAGANENPEECEFRPQDLPLYVLVEKILGVHERLPRGWPVAGTTGYDVLNRINGVFIDPHGFRQLDTFYRHFSKQTMSPDDVVYEAKRLILRVAMASELQMLARQLNRLSEQHRSTRDFTLNSLRAVLREIIASSDVYRTYVAEGNVHETDQQTVATAVIRARRRNPTIERSIFNYVARVLLLKLPEGSKEEARSQAEHFVQRLQQLMGPVTAKGVEDTAFYRYFPLASVNEVGGELNHISDIQEFHTSNASRCRLNLICTTTHDTKRTEDTRARINVLSEVPDWWRKNVRRWSQLNSVHRADLDSGPAPSRNDEYLFYQSLVGIWPLEPPNADQLQEIISRLQQYMTKAIHEAKLRSSWIDPDEEYDQAIVNFIAATMQDLSSPFMMEFVAFHEKILSAGLYTALSQVVLKTTVPGVPDFYQGQELWDFSLVDPDNRRPVDYTIRRELLTKLKRSVEEDGKKQVASQLARQIQDPASKLYVTWQGLECRARHKDVFLNGEYVPLKAHGSRNEHLCVYQFRSTADDRTNILVLAPVRLGRLMRVQSEPVLPLGHEAWQDCHLTLDSADPTQWSNIFTGETIQTENGNLSVAEALADFPVAIFESV